MYRKLVLLLIALLPAYLVRFTFIGFPTNVLEISIVVVFLAGLASSPVRLRWRQALSALSWKVKILTSLFVLAAVCSVLVSPHIITSLGVLKGWVVVPILLGWLVYAQLWDNKRFAEQVQDALVLPALFVSVVGLFQAAALVRVHSVYVVPNSLALFVVPVLVITLLRAVVLRSTVLFALAIPMAVAVALTRSVGGFVAAVTALVVGMYLLRTSVRMRMYLLIGLMLAVFAGGIVLSGKVHYLLLPGSSAYVRVQLWSISADLIRHNPLLGVGLGTFEPAYQVALHQRFAAYDIGVLAARPLPEFVFRDPHNIILSVWLNTGLLGLVSFVALFAVPFARINTLSTQRKLAVIAIFSLIIFGLVDTAYWKNDLAALWWVLLGITLSHQAQESDLS